MGTTFSSAKDQKMYMRSPDLAAPDSHALVCELISEIGSFDFAGIVSLGPVGVGKSSNLNTIASYLSNRLEQEAAAGSGMTTLTPECKSHVISYQGRPVKWKWMDTPGDLFSALVEKWKRSQLPETSDEYVSPDDYDRFLQEQFIQVLLSHQLGCVMAMISGVEVFSQASRVPHGDPNARLVIEEGSRLHCHIQVLKHLYRQLVQQGLRCICILTKVDLIDEAVEEDVAAVQQSFAVHQLRQCISHATGIPMNQVHPVVNLVREFEPQSNLALGHLALFNVRAALRAASHVRIKPPHPSAVRSPTPNWDTLTVPSPIVGKDGTSGRSFPVEDNDSPPAMAMLSNGKSPLAEQASDEAEELVQKLSPQLASPESEDSAGHISKPALTNGW